MCEPFVTQISTRQSSSFETDRSRDQNMALTRWPPRSPDLTHSDFFLCGYSKDRDLVLPLPVSVNDIKQRITTALASVDEGQTVCLE
jgi:hypothetical protein